MATTTTEDKAAAVLEERPELDPKTLNSFRRLGFLQADLDPLGRLRAGPQPALAEEADPATAAWARRRYCGTVGAEFMHIPQAERRRWIAERLETDPAPPDRDRVLAQIMSAETFEQLLQTRYQGSKRFSIEGVAALIPALDELLERAAAHSGVQVVLAMSHRGRLSVMLNVIGRPAAQIFARFDDVDARSVLGAGDVKYHMGATGTFRARNGSELVLHLVSNPSHLEAVDPVALGRVHAKQVRLEDRDFTKGRAGVVAGD